MFRLKAAYGEYNILLLGLAYLLHRHDWVSEQISALHNINTNNNDI